MVKILIVDDEEVARLTLAEILRLEGYEIKSVGSGEAALELLRCEPFDIMILDLKMGGMSGMDLLRAVVDSLPTLSVIVMTAYGTIDSAIQAIRYRVHDYLLKPASPEQVLESIENALEKKRMARETGVSEESISERVYDEHARPSGKMDILPGGSQLSWDKRQISWETGSLSLTPTEARLLKILFDRKNEMVSHSELVYLIQGYRIDTEEAAKILRPVVSRLRQKLSSVPDWGDRIKNVRGAGYVLEIN
jgi:DNA-binding response OmpR family regulator